MLAKIDTKKCPITGENIKIRPTKKTTPNIKYEEVETDTDTFKHEQEVITDTDTSEQEQETETNIVTHKTV